MNAFADADPVMVAVLATSALAALLGLVVLLRRAPDAAPELQALRRETLDAIGAQQETLRRLEISLYEHLGSQGAQTRTELGAAVGQFGATLTQQMTAIAGLQNSQIDSFAQQLTRLTESNEQRLAALREAVQEDARLMRNTLEAKLHALQTENSAKLEEMRRTVDEKLHATLEQRLGESFKHVSERLEQVHRGLGEMQALASNVGDLKRVLSNVKMRGGWGEVQLGALLEEMLVAEQYASNVATVPGSANRVEFAIRLPGTGDDQPVWLPIDAKFPLEDYERLLQAQEIADTPAALAAGKQLETRLRLEAKTIREKYLSPPHTTDFGLMFLPVEGLYAEALRRPGLLDDLQRQHRVIVAGPTTLAAILSSLQMGFRTLAVEKRTSEVWLLLGAVKTEFGKFGDVLAKARRQIDQASSTLGTYEVRSRAIERKLRDVQQLPETATRRLLDARSDRSGDTSDGGARADRPDNTADDDALAEDDALIDEGALADDDALVDEGANDADAESFGEPSRGGGESRD